MSRIHQRQTLKAILRSTLLLSAAFLVACGGSSTSTTTPTSPPKTEIPAEITELWSQTIDSYLQDDLWLKTNNYDAANILMVPMHWAYSVEEATEYREDFESYFERYRLNGFLDEENQLRKLQYLYLHSQYLKLYLEEYGTLSETENALKSELLNDIAYQWTEREVRAYGNYPPFQGMRDRLIFKLNTVAPDPERARAIFDEEFYVVAIASDLVALGEESEILDEVVETGYLMYTQETMEVGEGMLFQPGVWSHHPDYIYAGNEFLAPDLVPMIIEDIPTDSSHMHRMGLWLKSLADTFDQTSPEYTRINNIYERLKWQFENVMLERSDDAFPAPRLLNYSNGWNGVYRYSYNTVGDNLGYGPYDISGTLAYSWYPFLDSDVLREEFSGLNFPLSTEVVTQYTGPNTTRERHPLVLWPDYFTNGFAELNMRIAAELYN